MCTYVLFKLLAEPLFSKVGQTPSICLFWRSVTKYNRVKRMQCITRNLEKMGRADLSLKDGKGFNLLDGRERGTLPLHSCKL